MDIAWMAWTWQTAVFFAGLGGVLAVMTILGLVRPEAERLGVLGITTTRGDRLFISLIGSAFIHLAWLGLVGPNLWWALGLSAVYAFAVFRWV
jgi:predicted small integral membrane protein